MIKSIQISKKEKQYLMLILLLSFMIKAMLAFTLEAEIRSDSMVYDKLAASIAQSGMYMLDGKITATIICGYPLFLSGIYKVLGSDQTYVRLIQSLLEIFTCLFFFFICRRFFNIKYSLIGTVIFAFLPSNILYSQTILTEPLFGFISMVLLYLCLREEFPSHIFWLGALWGIAILVRSSFALSVLIIPIYLIVYRRKFFEGYKSNRVKRSVQYSALFIAGVLIILAPWLIRNKIEVGSFTLATMGGYTFWVGNNPAATGTWIDDVDETSALFNEDDEAKRDSEYLRQGLSYIAEKPHKFLITGIKKIGYLFSSERMILLYFTHAKENQTSTQAYKEINPIYTAIVNIPYFIVMIAGLWGLIGLRKYRFLIYCIVLTWVLTNFLFFGLSRYHYVLIPFFVLGAVIVFAEKKSLFQRLKLSEKIAGAVISVFFIAVWAAEFYLMYRGG